MINGHVLVYDMRKDCRCHRGNISVKMWDFFGFELFNGVKRIRKETNLIRKIKAEKISRKKKKGNRKQEPRLLVTKKETKITRTGK